MRPDVETLYAKIQAGKAAALAESCPRCARTLRSIHRLAKAKMNLIRIITAYRARFPVDRTRALMFIERADPKMQRWLAETQAWTAQVQKCCLT